MALLNLIRWKNLIMLLYTLVLIKFVLFQKFEIQQNLKPISFFIFVAAILFIMAAGYIINDIIDQKADTLNKPNKTYIGTLFSVEKAHNLYKNFNTIGLVLGVVFSFKINSPSTALIFLGAALLLYFYSKKLKGMFVIGNFLVAFLICFPILFLSYLETHFSFNNEGYKAVNSILVMLSIFAFLLNLAREIIKDVEDIKGDYLLKMKTLPIILGRAVTLKIVEVIYSIIFISVLVIAILFKNEYPNTIAYLVVTIALPIGFYLVKKSNKNPEKEAKTQSIFLKICMFLGINSILILSFLD